ncbi:hypothetical protein NDU88_003517 [Pleurodeles waltl]|uniref:Uncharacterized protein n=1 Tax=Pleurodeles waltl TaxID=8319 RepID=A0AAV7V096_PLEWA|nr:hypothetical protein NDU88_003517 [Pleurodeles waltl]
MTSRGATKHCQRNSNKVVDECEHYSESHVDGSFLASGDSMWTWSMMREILESAGHEDADIVNWCIGVFQDANKQIDAIINSAENHGVSSLGSTKAIPLCDDSSVSVECLGAERLIVNITWRSPLEAIPTAALPDLHDIDHWESHYFVLFLTENAVAGDGLVGRFVAMIRSGDYLLNVDSKQFPADMSIDFPQDADFSLSPLIQLGCMKGFRRIYDMQRSPAGCGMFYVENRFRADP